MKNLHDIWSKRFVFYINELQKYLRFIVSGHLALVLVFAIGAAGYAYSEWLNSAPEDFPAFLLVSFLLGLVLTMSTPVTLLKNADSVYFLPLEMKLGEYNRLALRWTYFSSLFLSLAIFIVAIPLLTKIGGSSKEEIITLFLLVLVLKYWSIRTEFIVRWASNGNGIWMDRFVRFLLTGVALYFTMVSSYLFLLLMGIILVVYFIVWNKKRFEVSFPFDHFIAVEQSRMMRFYRFANYFTDVPYIRGATKRRGWLSFFYRFAPYGPTNAQLYLILRTFIRTDDYFYLWVRLTGLSLIGAVFIPFPIVSIIFSGALAFATVIQLKHALLSGHEFRMDLLYPIGEEARVKAVDKLIRIIQLIQAAVVLVGVFIQGELSGLHFLIPVAAFIISEITIRVSKVG